MSSNNGSPRRSSSLNTNRSFRSSSRSKRPSSDATSKSTQQGDEYFDLNEVVSTPRRQALEMEQSAPRSSPLQKIVSSFSRSNSIASSNSYSTTGNESTATAIQTTRLYKGFSTPLSKILSTFSAPSIIASIHETDEENTELSSSHLRTDLCSLSLFGILQSDHTRYLFTHHRPPTLFKRLCLHFITPVVLFVTAGWMSGHIVNDYVNNLVCTTLVWFVFLWICVGCFRSRKKRVMVREEILWRLKRRQERFMKRKEEERRSGRGRKRSFGLVNVKEDNVPEEDYEYYSEDEEEYERLAKNLGLKELGQTRWEMNCAHRMCGCYPADFLESDFLQNNNSNNNQIEEVHRVCCACLSSPHLTCIPCGNGSQGCHPQFCGLWAVAQEGREANLTLPRHLRMIDYITMEPYLLYYPRILELRRNKSGELMDHIQALSKLSIVLLRGWGVILMLLLGLSLWNAIGYWKLQDMAILCATFLQAILVVYAVHWGWHRFDLSVDAVIKYFACGFAMCSVMAFTVELLLAGVFRLMVMGVIWTMGVTEVVDNGYGGGGLHVKFDDWDGSMHSGARRALSGDSDILHGFFSRHPVARVIYVLVSSYLAAGFIEELCKYFGFLMVDHPDFCSEKELAKAHSSLPLQLLRDRADEMDEADNEQGHTTTVVREDEATSLANFDPSKQRRSQSSIRDGVTVAMVAVALGFACCENILHILIYNRSSLRSEIDVLLIKSLFPIHPLCAAIQSIQVCKRDLEKNKSIGVGRIVLFSVVLHGTYDAALLFLNQSWQRTHKENYFYEGTNGKIGIALISAVTSMFILSLGIIYYMLRSQAQYMRLRGRPMRAEVVGISLESGFLS